MTIRALLIGATVAAISGCGPKSLIGESCAKTADCESGLSCLKSECRDVAAEAAAAAAAEARRPLEEARAETLKNLSWMRTSEKTHHALNDEYLVAKPCPEQRPTGLDPVGFALCGITWSKDPDAWMTLPYEVRCQYSVTLVGDQSTLDSSDFEVKAVCDTDGDGVEAVYVATKAEEAKARTPPEVY